MPKVNVYLPTDLATAVRDAQIPVSEVCQRALALELTRSSRTPPTKKRSAAAMTVLQSIEERAADQARAAEAWRFALDPEPATVPARLKPLGAATALATIKMTSPAFVHWENKAQDVAVQAAAVAVCEELGAPASVTALFQERLDTARRELAEIELPTDLGPADQLIDLLVELAERAHPAPPR